MKELNMHVYVDGSEESRRVVDTLDILGIPYRKSEVVGPALGDPMETPQMIVPWDWESVPFKAEPIVGESRIKKFAIQYAQDRRDIDFCKILHYRRN